MTIEELKARSEFAMLDTQQQQWVIAFCTNGRNKREATKTAYPNASDASIPVISNRNLRHGTIKILLKLWFEQGDDVGSRQEALAIIWTQIQNEKDPKLKLDYLKLFGDWKGFKTDKPEDPGDSPDDIIDRL